MTTIDTLKRLGFEHHGTLNARTASLKAPGVYVMLLDGEPFNIGEGKNVEARLKSYVKWLANENSRPFELKQRAVWNAIVGSSNLELYVRASDTIECFGETISLHKAEEAALHLKFDPRWNSDRRRGFTEVEYDAIVKS